MEQPREPKYNPTDRANKDIQRAYEELTNPNMLEIEKIDYLFQYERIIKAVSKDILRLIYTIKEEDKEEEKENARKEYLDRKGIHSSFRW